jgi:hypothetical protein
MVGLVFAMGLYLLSSQAVAHTLYLLADPEHPPASSPSTLTLINGTLWVSENAVSPERLKRFDVVDPTGKITGETTEQWLVNDRVTTLARTFDTPGTWVFGVATSPSNVFLNAEDFDYYLRYEGLLDSIEERRNLDESAVAVSERYTKYAKVVLTTADGAHAGDASTSYRQVLGYPAEIVPEVNPANLHQGDRFRARILADGKPLSGMLVYANCQSHNVQDAEGIHEELVSVRSDQQGIVEFELTEPGRWYVRFIQIERLEGNEYWYTDFLVWLGIEEERVSYRSDWATLTFDTAPAVAD